MINPSLNAAVSRNSTPLVIGAIAAQVIGGSFAQMSPFVVAGLMDGMGLSERDAGIVTSIELFALALSAILVAPMLPWLSCRQVCLGAAALTLIAQGASIIAAGWTTLVALRALAGVGEGVLYALSLSIVASHATNPEKVFGYFQLVWALGSVPLFSAGGEITAAFAHRGIFALLCGVSLALAPLLFQIPDTPASDGTRYGPNGGITRPLVGATLLTAIVLYISVSAALYAFSTSFGARAGLDTAEVGYILTIATLVGLAGGAAATALNIRWGRALPISVFCLSYALVALALCLWQNSTVFVITLVLSVVLYYFSVPYLFGLAAAIDRSGRWAAAAGSAYLLGFAAGPILGGAVIKSAGYASLAVVSVGLMTITWALSMIVLSRGVAGRSTGPM